MLTIRAPRTAADWDACFALRWQVLRAPWGQPRGSERDEFETIGVHRMVCDTAGALLGVGRLHPLGGQLAQIRYMAVADTQRCLGIGTLLLRALEAAAGDAGWHRIILHARAPAVPFYQKRGYQVIEKSHLLYGEIQHYKMHRQLPEQNIC